MPRQKDVGDLLVADILEHYWDADCDFEEWAEFELSRKLAKLVTGTERIEIDND